MAAPRTGTVPMTTTSRADAVALSGAPVVVSVGGVETDGPGAGDVAGAGADGGGACGGGTGAGGCGAACANARAGHQALISAAVRVEQSFDATGFPGVLLVAWFLLHH